MKIEINTILFMKKIISKIKWVSLGALLFPLSVMAVTIPTPPSGSGVPTSLTTAVGSIINAVIGIIGLIAVVVIVIGGVFLITSGGDEEKTKEGKNYITYGIIGVIVVVLAYSIVTFVIGGIK